MSEIFKKIFEASPVAKILVDSDSKIKFMNTCAEKLFGYSRKDLIGNDISILVPIERRNKHPELVKSFFEAPLPRMMGRGRNLLGIKKDGSSFPVEVGLSPIETEDGLLVMSSIIDLTMQFFAEERFRSAVESAPNGMLTIDAKGTITMVNKQIEDMFGYDRKELLGSPIEVLVPDEFKGHHPKFVESFIQNPKPRSMGIGRELFGKKKSGTLFPVEIGLQPLKEKENSILVLASIVDISKRRQAEKEIEEKSEELQEFAYRTSHDLRAPLTTMTAMIKCVIEDVEENEREEAITNLRKMEVISKNLQSLVQTILFLTKADLIDDGLNKFDFEGCISNLKLSHKSQFDASGVTLEIFFNHSKDLVIQNSKLSQTIENLVSNAIKFSNRDQHSKFIKISTYSDADFFYLQVRDNGIGIPEDRQEEVFSMFKRFHENVEGHGIGLYMVKKFVNKMNGEITFESNESGTCFYLKFPLSAK